MFHLSGKRNGMNHMQSVKNVITKQKNNGHQAVVRLVHCVPIFAIKEPTFTPILLLAECSLFFSFACSYQEYRLSSFFFAPVFLFFVNPWARFFPGQSDFNAAIEKWWRLHLYSDTDMLLLLLLFLPWPQPPQLTDAIHINLTHPITFWNL